MIELVATPAPAPVAPRKPTKLMENLTAAIRATAEAARDQALSQVDTDVATVVEEIRLGAKDEEVSLRERSDEDITRIREWSRAEIARIKEETERKIEARKAALGDELAAHAAAIDRRVEDVHGQVEAYRAQMAAFSAHLGTEDDPSRLATMAESMPEPPVLGSPSVDELLGSAWAGADVATALPEMPAALVEVAPADAEPESGATEWAEEPWEAAEVAPADGTATFSYGALNPWATGADAPADQADEAEAGQADEAVAADEVVMTDELDAGAPRWATGEIPDGFPTGGAAGGETVDRGAIMAALEAAAEAVVAAEAAADSADHAEAAADVAETAAELLVGRAGADEDLDPEAQAAFSARVDAGGFETDSLADRLAYLMPSQDDAIESGEPRTTQVVVSGLVSVASIASFKRHLGRTPGVQAVAVASGPDGEFVFKVTHRADVSFREALASMPGFAARVTSAEDGVVVVTARDPETEG